MAETRAAAMAWMAVFMLAATYMPGCEAGSSKGWYNTYTYYTKQPYVPAPPPPPPPPTILSVISRYPNLSLLKAGLQLYPEFNTPITTTSSDLTVFAPTDEAILKAFATLGLSTWDPSSSVLPSVLKYHIVTSSLNARELSHAQVLPTLLPGSSLTVDLLASPSPIIRGRNSDASVIQADIPAGQSVIHIIDDVLLPINPSPVSSSTILTAASSAGLTSLAAAVTKAGLDSVLSNPDLEYTVFAPTNEAFSSALSSLGYTLETIPVSVLTTILKYHVLSSYRTTFSFVSNEQVTTLEGQTLRFFYGFRNSVQGSWITRGRPSGPLGGPFIQAISSTSAITTANVFAGKSVVHVIDTVLVPRLPPKPKPVYDGYIKYKGYRTYGSYVKG